MEYNQDKWGKTSTEVSKKYKEYIIAAMLNLLFIPIFYYIILRYFDIEVEVGEHVVIYIFFICSFLFHCYMSFKGINISNYLEKEEKKRLEEHNRRAEEGKKKKKKNDNAKKKKIDDLKEKYGDEYGTKIYRKIVAKGMTKEMVIRSKGIPKCKDGNNWFYKVPFDECVIFDKEERVKKNDKKNVSFGFIYGMSKKALKISRGKPDYKATNVSFTDSFEKQLKGDKWYYGKPFDEEFILIKNKIHDWNPINDGLWLDMPKDMLIESYGKPEDEKKEVSKKGTKLRWYYGGRETRQGTTAYSTEVRLENDIVVGWKELE